MEESWNVKSCRSRSWASSDLNLTDTGGQQHCRPVWDGFSCWGPTPAGSTASARCPSFKGSDVTKSAFRICGATGDWLDRDGLPSPVGWTNYTPCLTPEIREIMRKLGSNEDAQIKLNIAANTRILEFVGLSLSLAALLLSLLIFYYFRTLRNSRTRLHRHLFIALVIQVGIRLIVYTDQAITRSFGAEENTNESAYSSSQYMVAGGSDVGESTMYRHQGIDNTPILCEASYISLEYARTAMFMWMFVEGLFLHNMITVTVFEEKLSPLVYPIIGWIIPIPLTVAWALVTHLHYGTATCWWGYNFTLYFWILEGPRLAVLMVNLAFLLNILRVLVMKLRQSNSSETQQAMKAVKAALVLLPLLGLTNLLNMLDAPLEKSPFQFALWSYTTHLLTSTQGFILALLYCFRNGEVQIAVRKFVRTRILGNSKHIILAKRAIPLSALDNGSLFHAVEESQAASCSQTVNMMNPHAMPGSPMVTVNGRSCATAPNSSAAFSQSNCSSHTPNRSNKNTRKNKKTHCSNNNYSTSKTAFSSPVGSAVGFCGGPPPPLIVRSFSNGVLKQTAIRTDRGESQHSQQQRRFYPQTKLSHQQHRNSTHSNSENERLLQRNSSCYDDYYNGKRVPFQQRQDVNDETVPTPRTLSSSSQQHNQQLPIITPMTSSSSWSSSSSASSMNKGHSDSHHKSKPSSQEYNKHHECTDHCKSMKSKQANSWRMLIIPDYLLKRKSGDTSPVVTCQHQLSINSDIVSPSFRHPHSPKILQLSSSPSGRETISLNKQRNKSITLDGSSISSNEENVSPEVNQTDSIPCCEVGHAGAPVLPGFVAIEIPKDEEGYSHERRVDVAFIENNKSISRTNGSPSPRLYGTRSNDNLSDSEDNMDEDVEATVQIEVEIIKI